MFCGSCMHDNTLARALLDIGVEVTLVPTYTPIRVDEQNVSVNEVFLGGINVYLDSKVPLWSRLPRFVKRAFDAPWFIRFATQFGVSNDAGELGDLTVAMLQGENGPQKSEIAELVRFLSHQLKPDVILFSNALLAGVMPTLKQEFSGKVFCLLQGDDIFLEGLREPWKSQALDLIAERAALFDGYLVHTKFYRDFMSNYLSLPIDRFHTIPLGIDFADFDGLPKSNAETNSDSPFTVGYFARICKEKGLRELVDAFLTFEQKFERPCRLRAGGFCADKNYLQDVLKRARPLGDRFEHVADIPDRKTKAEFLQSIDLLAVPTIYREPKGLYVLEALANGVPVLQPDHGSFPELIQATGGGMLHPPCDTSALVDSMLKLAHDRELLNQLAVSGHQRVRETFNTTVMAQRTAKVLQSAIDNATTASQ